MIVSAQTLRPKQSCVGCEQIVRGLIEGFHWRRTDDFVQLRTHSEKNEPEIMGNAEKRAHYAIRSEGDHLRDIAENSFKND